MSNPYDKQIGGDHYQNMKIQPAEFINKNKMKFAEGNAIKYICRHINKGGKQDLEKAKHYIDMIIERDYGDEAEMSKTFTPSVEPEVNMTYEGLSVNFPEGSENDKTEDEIPSISYTFDNETK
mgnify:FL=1